MDKTIYPGSRISRLPKPLKLPALMIRSLVASGDAPAAFTYNHDGLATERYSPFLDDSAWDELYWRMVREWFPTQPGTDVRWRMWTLTEWAKRTDGLGGFAEFGTWRGGCAFMVLSLTVDSQLHLFDTFAGTPAGRLTAQEAAAGFGGRLSDTSVGYVETLLAPWKERIRIHAGDIFDTLENLETGALAMVHMDLNAAAPTRRALEYVDQRLIHGGVIVFDDYGAREYEEQREVIDSFYSDRSDRPVALPTGQAVLVKLHPNPAGATSE